MSGASNHATCMDVLKRNREAIGKEPNIIAGTTSANTNSSTTGRSMLTSGNAAFDSMMKQQYKNLIAEYRKRHNLKAGNTRTSKDNGKRWTEDTEDGTTEKALTSNPDLKQKEMSTSSSTTTTSRTASSQSISKGNPNEATSSSITSIPQSSITMVETRRPKGTPSVISKKDPSYATTTSNPHSPNLQSPKPVSTIENPYTTSSKFSSSGNLQSPKEKCSTSSIRNPYSPSRNSAKSPKGMITSSQMNKPSMVALATLHDSPVAPSSSKATTKNVSMTSSESVNDMLLREFLSRSEGNGTQVTVLHAGLKNGGSSSSKLSSSASTTPSSLLGGEEPKLFPRLSKKSTPPKRPKQWKCTACTFINAHSAWSNTKPRCKMCNSAWEIKMDIIIPPRSNGTPKTSGYIEIDC